MSEAITPVSSCDFFALQIGTVENPAEHPLHQFAPMDEYFNDGFHSEVIVSADD